MVTTHRRAVRQQLGNTKGMLMKIIKRDIKLGAETREQKHSIGNVRKDGIISAFGNMATGAFKWKVSKGGIGIGTGWQRARTRGHSLARARTRTWDSGRSGRMTSVDSGCSRCTIQERHGDKIILGDFMKV